MIRRLLLILAGAAALALPAAAQNTVKVQVGGDLAARAGELVDIPVTVDMRQAGGALLGAYRVRLAWDTTVLQFANIEHGNFGNLTVSVDSAFAFGLMRAGALMPGGMGGVVTLFTMQMFVRTDTLVSPVTITVEDLTAAGTFADLLPIAQVTSGTFCRALGRWGDTNDDGRTDSRDALIALSHVVGLIDTIRIDTLNTNPLITDTTYAKLADVDADGSVTSRDALIILSNAVGLPVTGFRIGITAAGSCATGAAATLVILPDTIDLEIGQQALVVVQARDAAGRVVPTPTITWRTSDGTIAALAGPSFDDMRQSPLAGGGGLLALAQPVGIEGRGTGTATLTAEAGPGIRTTLVVQVMARRHVWHVDVQAAHGARTATGSLRYPFGLIDDAMRAARNGDTVRVAPGVYREAPSEYKALTILGDPANRPIIDPRGSGWTSGSAIYVGNPSGRATVAHMIFRAGGLYMEGHDNEVRKVRFENIHSFDYALEIYSEAQSQPTGPTGGPPGSYGNVLIDSVEVIGSMTEHAIVIDQADTVILRNSSVVGDSVQTGCFTNAFAVYEAQLVRVHDNVFSQLCRGLELWTNDNNSGGRIELSRNRITGFSGDALELSSTVIRMDHNVIRGGRSPSSQSGTGQGVYVRYGYVDSVSMVGDSIVDVTYRGIFIDSAGAADFDGITVDSTGQDSSFSSHGLEIRRGALTLRNSRIANVINGDGIRTCDAGILRTRGNEIRDITFNGISGTFCFDITGPDSMLSAHDTIANTGADGYFASGARAVRLDSIQVDSAGSSAVRLSSTFRASVTGGTFRRSGDGIAANSVDSMAVSGATIDLIANVGLELNGQLDTARVAASIVNAATVGVRVGSGAARIDSTRITNHLTDGLAITFGGAARVRHSRFTGNGVGIRLESGGLATLVHQSVIAGNLSRQGVRNDAGPSMPLDADTNFWGDALGPACASGCAPGSTGDSVLTADVTFANHLGASPAVPAPPAFLSTGPRTALPLRRGLVAVTQQPQAVRVEGSRPPRGDRRRVPNSQSGEQGPRN